MNFEDRETSAGAQLGLEVKTKRPRRRRVQIREREVYHDDGEGNWLVSYADLMTLLFGFFVILVAFSTPDAAKMEKLKEETAKSMKVSYTKPYVELSSSLKAILKDMSLDKEVTITETPDGVDLVLNGSLFFDSGSSVLNKEASAVMERMAPILVQQARGFRITVEGHTDDVPIVSKAFPSNWELSSARAGSMIRTLEKLKFPHQDLRPVGLADTEPLVQNRDTRGVGIPENRAKNRRIVIRIQKQLPKRMENNKTS